MHMLLKWDHLIFQWIYTIMWNMELNCMNEKCICMNYACVIVLLLFSSFAFFLRCFPKTVMCKCYTQFSMNEKAIHSWTTSRYQFPTFHIEADANNRQHSCWCIDAHFECANCNGKQTHSPQFTCIFQWTGP